MVYKYLRVLSYDDQEAYKKEVDNRTSNPLKRTTPFFITPYNRQEKVYGLNYNLFYLPINKLSKAKDELFYNSREIVELLNSLPPIAQQKVFISNLIEEIQSTNDIEGVRSSRKEIGEAIHSILEKEESSKRFQGIVNLYMKFQDSEYSSIKKIEDIRSIYDELLDGEIKEEDIPDGEIFRKEPVYVKKNDKNVHEGVKSEEKIIESLNTLISFMNDHTIPDLEKCMASHYFLEYVHPFYDGNGRLGRFIACSYLSRKLDPLSAISFSTSIKKQKGNYGVAFSEVSNPRNHGELTLFVITMFDFLKEGQLSIIDNLKAGKASLHEIHSILEEEKLTELEFTLMFILTQEFLFSSIEDKLKDMDFTEILNGKYSRRTINTSLKALRDRDYLKQISKKPSVHEFSATFKTRLNSVV